MTKKWTRILLAVFAVLIVAIASGLSYLSFALPNVGEAPTLQVKATPQMIARGKYLAQHVTICLDCHSERDWTKFSGPMVAGTEGKGGEHFDQKYGFPGAYISPNITPTHLGNWTDGEIFRAITCGVSKDGHALFPIMPYPNYGKLSEEDIHAVIAYIRTLKPIDHQPEASSSDFPMNFIINTIPEPAQLAPKPDPSDQIAYGKYLVTAASCIDCHTKQEKGQFVGDFFAGGMEFPLPDGSLVRSPNITPHPGTGIGTWSEAQFVQRFKSYADSSYVAPTVKAGEFQTLMPWTMYAGMKEQDLQAIYAYLKSLEPVEHTVERFVSMENR